MVVASIVILVEFRTNDLIIGYTQSPSTLLNRENRPNLTNMLP